MALRKSIEIGNSGLNGEYWKVTREYRITEDDTFHGFVECYRDAASRLEGKNPIPGSRTRLMLAGFGITALDAHNPVFLAYDKLKTGGDDILLMGDREKSFFTDAEDC